MTDEAKVRSKPRVLLVEDTVYLARLYEKYLQDEDYDLVHVETGGDALRSLDHDIPDAVLLDLVLPDMSGLDILNADHPRRPRFRTHATPWRRRQGGQLLDVVRRQGAGHCSGLRPPADVPSDLVRPSRREPVPVRSR